MLRRPAMRARALRLPLLCLLLATATLVALSPSSASAQDRDVDDYLSLLRRAAADLRAPNPDAASSAALLESAGPLSGPAGDAIQPDLSPVIADLRAAPPNVDRALARLDALVVTVERATSAAPPADHPRASLDSILDRSEFAVEDEDRSPTLRERISDWLSDRLSPLVDWLGELLSPVIGSGEGSSGAVLLRAILGAIGVVVVVAVIVQVVRSVRQSMAASVAHLEQQAETRLTALDARAEAERLFREGKHREALRSLYLATLLRLDETGRLRFDRSQTNREVLRAARVHGDEPLRQRLAPIVERFDRVWYGGEQCSADDYRAFSGLVDVVWEAPA